MSADNSQRPLGSDRKGFCCRGTGPRLGPERVSPLSLGASALGCVRGFGFVYPLRMAARYRWRTWLRRNLPWVVIKLGIVGKGPRDCGDDDWYNDDGLVERCYHCVPGERAYDPSHFPRF